VSVESEFFTERLNSSCTSYCHYRLKEAKTEAPRMVKMRFEVAVSVATAATAFKTATVNQLKVVVAGKVHHVVNINAIPANRITGKKRRFVHLNGKHKLSKLMWRDSTLRTSFRGLSKEMLYLLLTLYSNDAFIFDKVNLETESKQIQAHIRMQYLINATCRTV
jgi:hypothetical protein